MSYLVVDAVLLTFGIPQTPKAVLTALAQHAHHNGTHARPSQERIAKMMGLSERSTQRGLAWLEAHGLIVPTAHDSGGRGNAVEYAIRLERLQGIRGEELNPAIVAGINGGTPANSTPKPRHIEGKTPPTRRLNLAIVADQSVLESVRESGKRESPDGHDAANSAAVAVSLSHNKHIQAEAEPEADREVGALIAALETHCAPARRSQRAETPQIAREMLREGATPDMIRKRHKLLHEKWNTSTKAYIAVTPHVLWEHWDEVKSSTELATERHARSRQNDEDLAARRREAKSGLVGTYHDDNDDDDDAARLRRYQQSMNEMVAEIVEEHKREWRYLIETGQLTEEDAQAIGGAEQWFALTPEEREKRLRDASA
ncbi:MAG TPA: helix-turn-helix domain-containing protein [Ktedonobacterales bacterium]